MIRRFLHGSRLLGHALRETVARHGELLGGRRAADDPHVFDAIIEKIEFLGSFCHVHVNSPAFAPHKLTVYLSLNFLTEQSLAVDSPLRLKLLPERLRIF